MLVGSKRPLFAAASTASPSAVSKFLIMAICSRSSFDVSSLPKKNCTATILFHRKTIGVETAIASPAEPASDVQANRRMMRAPARSELRSGVELFREWTTSQDISFDRAGNHRDCPIRAPMAMATVGAANSDAQWRFTDSPWSAQAAISAPKTSTGNKPKTTAQTTKEETITMSCFHRAQRPIGYLEE
jgi:hypothetical protein